MEESRWRQHEKDGLYFINQNLNKRGIEPDTTDFARKNKIIWIAIPLVVLSLICAGIAMFTRSILIALPATLASIWLYIFILRKKVWDENMFKRLRSSNSMNKEFGMDGMFNNLLSIDENSGQWFFQNNDQGLRTAFLITFDYGSILDQSMNANQNAINQAFVPFIKQLHDNHLSFKKFNIAIQEKVSAGTLELIRRARLLQDGSWLKLIETLQNETISNLEQNAGSQYKLFFLVYNKDFRNVTGFEGLLKTIINSSLTNVTSIVNPRICKTDEILNFIVNYYQIDSYDENSIVRNVQRMDISKFFNFISFIDINGVEYTLSDILDLSDDSNQYFTEDIIINRANDFDRKEKKKKQQEKQAQANKEKQRLNEIIRRQAKHDNLMKQNQKLVAQGKKPLTGSSQGLQVASFGIARGTMADRKFAEQQNLDLQKIKQDKMIEERKKQRELQIKQQNSSVNLNDNTSIDDLLKITDDMKEDDK